MALATWRLHSAPALGGSGRMFNRVLLHERTWEGRDELSLIFKKGAKVLGCGSASKRGERSANVCEKIWLGKNPGKTQGEASEWLQEIREERYVSGVFD